MFTILALFILFVLIIPSGIAAQRWLFKESNEVYDRQWALYEQRHD